MSTVIEASFKDWESFRQGYRSVLFGSRKAEKSRFLFRGQADADWRLESAFDRWYTSRGYKRRERSSVFRELIEDFRTEVSNSHDHKLAESLTDEEMMAWGQHFGLPTRLLDWSKSLYVAAYFACSPVLFGEVKSRKVAVWALDSSASVFENEEGAKIVEVKPRFNARLRNQEGSFTLLNSTKDSLDEFVMDAVADDEGPVLWKFILPAETALDAITDLDFIGFGAYRLFPDVQGYALSALINRLIKEESARAVHGTAG